MKQLTHAELEEVGKLAHGMLDDRFIELPEIEQEETVEHYGGFMAKLDLWIRNGKGIAVYQNHDFGSTNMGHYRFFPYGTVDAQFPGDPPERLPDFEGEINWRYVLVATYRATAKERHPANILESIDKLNDVFDRQTEEPEG